MRSSARTHRPPARLLQTVCLQSLLLGSNHLCTYDDIAAITTVPSLVTIDLQDNRMDVDAAHSHDAFTRLFASMPNLSVLYLQGNPLVKKWPHYRKVLVGRCKGLHYLDDRPVDEAERRRCTVWCRVYDETLAKATGASVELAPAGAAGAAASAGDGAAAAAAAAGSSAAGTASDGCGSVGTAATAVPTAAAAPAAGAGALVAAPTPAQIAAAVAAANAAERAESEAIRKEVRSAAPQTAVCMASAARHAQSWRPHRPPSSSSVLPWLHIAARGGRRAPVPQLCGIRATFGRGVRRADGCVQTVRAQSRQ